jgi:hypothetical protein
MRRRRFEPMTDLRVRQQRGSGPSRARFLRSPDLATSLARLHGPWRSTAARPRAHHNYADSMRALVFARSRCSEPSWRANASPLRPVRGGPFQPHVQEAVRIGGTRPRGSLIVIECSASKLVTSSPPPSFPVSGPPNPRRPIIRGLLAECLDSRQGISGLRRKQRARRGRRTRCLRRGADRKGRCLTRRGQRSARAPTQERRGLIEELPW